MIEVNSADIMATLLELKKEVEGEIEASIKVTFSGAAEAHLLAKQIAEADVGVIVSPARPFPAVWSMRRM